MAEDKFDPTEDLVDLRGKVVIVSGANRGIGLETVRYLARAGAKVYLACRSKEAASDTIRVLRSASLAPGNGELKFLRLDLSDPGEAKKAAEEFLQLESRLDVLINNAGIRPAQDDLEAGAFGMSKIVITNHLSPFVFTKTLISLMIKTACLPGTDVRIVNLSSDAHWDFPGKDIRLETFEDLNFDPQTWPKLWAGTLRYAHTKLLNILWTKGLQKRFDDSEPAVPITVIAVHPGVVQTFKDEPFVVRLYGLIFGVKTEQGAHNPVFAAASKRVAAEREKYKGSYIRPIPRIGTISIPSPVADSDQNVEDLWRVTEDFLQKIRL